MFILKALSKLPLSVLYVLASFLYFIVYYVVGYRKKVVFENLKNSFPEKSEQELKKIQKRFYKNFADVIVEILHTYSMSAHEIQKRVTIKNPEIANTIFNDHKTSALGVVGHVCNWEWISHISCFKVDAPVDAVYKQLSSKKFDKFMLELRSRFGTKPVEMKRFPREIIKRKNEIRAYALIADQSPKKEEIKLWIPFLNQETGFYEGPASLAVMTNFPVFYVGIKRLKRGYYEVFFEKIASPPYTKEDVPLIMKRYAKLLEEQIKASPADWLWSHRRWKHKKPVA